MPPLPRPLSWHGAAQTNTRLYSLDRQAGTSSRQVLVAIARFARDSAHDHFPRAEGRPAVIHPMPYELEQAYHVQRQHAAAQRRLVARPKERSAAQPTFADWMRVLLRVDCADGRKWIRYAHALSRWL
jgi:hypothetical protein